MKYLIVSFLLVNTQYCLSQNVGIGTVSPSEKLDVNGHINIAGSVKLKGNAGRPGEVLQVGADGNQNWAAVSAKYKNRVEYFLPGTFTVPAGVRELMIEAVGSGGGGAKGGGGGGGGYAIAVVKVAPGDIISFTVSDLTQGAETETGNGTTNNGSSVTGMGINISGRSGSGAFGQGVGSGGDARALGDSLIYAKTLVGGTGQLTTEFYGQYTSTQFVTMRYYGNGGACPYNPIAVSHGSFLSYNTETLANIKLVFGTRASTTYSSGAGGAGGNTSSGRWGFSGNGGLVAISW